MLKTKTYDYKNKILDYGFIELEPGISTITIESLAESVKESLILADTKKLFLVDALKRLESYLNQNEKILVGVTDDSTLSNLKKNGVKNGFFRSTDEDFYVGIIIVDKKFCFIAFDVDHIYPVQEKYTSEVFGFVNHVLWSKANYEQCQDSLKKVEDTKLSVVIPSFTDDVDLNVNHFKYATESEGADCETTILAKEKEFGRKAVVIPFNFDGLSIDKNRLYVKTFLKNYYSIPLSDKSLFKFESFSNKSLSELSGKKIWYKGKLFDIKESDSANYTQSVPLDMIEAFVPNFDEKEKEYSNFTLKLTINFDIVPIKLDGSYSLSKRYGVIDNAKKQLDDGLLKLEKMGLDAKYKKQLESIESERDISEKIKMFNTFVSSQEFGVEALNNKKSSIPTIKVNEEDLQVPSEVIGRLYSKNGKAYLATSLKFVEESKKWLKEHKFEAELIEA